MSNHITSNQVPPCPGGTIYTIKPGDTFYAIAKAYKIDVNALIKANPNVNPNNLQIGQQICIPASAPAPCPGGTAYTIVAGDTYYSIARRFNTTVNALIAANPGVNPNNLQIGQVICLPSASTPVVYRNTQFGFTFTLPASWSGYSIVTSSWVGNDVTTGQVVATGPIISIRHPLWTPQNPRQDIPIMVFTLNQWNMLQQGKFHIGAAPIGPTELGRNSNYVFALPARYNYAFPTGYEEVERILQGHPLQPF